MSTNIKVIRFTGITAAILALLAYVVSLNMMLAAKGVELSGYQGTDKINSFSLAQLPAGALYTQDMKSS